MKRSKQVYRALAERNRSLALLWSLGQGLFAFGFIAVIGAPIDVAILTCIDPDLTRERALSAIQVSVAMGVLILVVSFALKRYAIRKAGIFGC